MRDALSAAQDAIDKVLLGKSHSIKLALACILAKGHLLIEDLPLNALDNDFLKKVFKSFENIS